MKLLLDTHVVLWWMDDPSRLARIANEAIDDPVNIPYLSAASVWEIAIKQALAKLDAPTDMLDQLVGRGVETLPVTAEHAWEVRSLPRHHDDPFDRMLVAQARLEGLVIVSRDPVMVRYGVPVLAG